MVHGGFSQGNLATALALYGERRFQNHRNTKRWMTSPPTKVQGYPKANFVDFGLKSSLRICIFVKWEKFLHFATDDKLRSSVRVPSRYFVSKFFHQLHLDFLDFQEPLPLIHEKVIYFLM
jgi:hypothetical protein